MFKKDKKKASPQASDDAITLEQTGETFSSAQLKDALKAASTFASSKKATDGATISLSSAIFPFKGVMSFTEQITLSGEEGANIVFDSNSGIEVKAGSFSVKDIVFSVSKSSKNGSCVFKVAKSGGLSLGKCSFEPEELEIGYFHAISSEGNVEISDSTFTNSSITSNNTLNVTNSKFQGKDAAEFSCISASGEVSVKDCSFEKVHQGVIANNGAVSLVNNVFETIQTSVTLEKVKAIVERCQFTSLEAEGVRVSGKQKLKVINSSFESCSQAMNIQDEANVKVMSCDVKELQKFGFQVTTGSMAVFEDITISGKSEAKSYGFHLKDARVNCKDVKLQNLFYGVYTDKGAFTFQGLNLSNCVYGVYWRNSAAKGQSLNIENCRNNAVEVIGHSSEVHVKEATISKGTVGIEVKEARGVEFVAVKLLGMKKIGILVTDSSAVIRQVHVNNNGTNGSGINILYTKPLKEKTLLDECKTQNCDTGIQVVQQYEEDTKSEDLAVPMETFHDSMHSRSNKYPSMLNSKTDLENCSFIKCKIGFLTDGARVNVKGCSFIMSKKHSIYIKNQKLTKGTELRKSSNLKIRWANFVEPHIDNSNAISNEPQLMANVTEEKAFFGSAEFEPVMYLPTLTERIRQSRNLKNSQEKDPVGKARVIMRSVHHMLVLLKQLSVKLLEGDLLEDPELGMFAATFQLFEADRNKKKSTLVDMNALFKSWQSLQRTRLFDKALGALNHAFNEKALSEDLYDEWVTPLEELQRVCFVKSKYNRRRDYLLMTAKANPLSAWYFLDKENPNTEEGKRLRSEVLKYLARDDDVLLPQQEQNFHGSWVSQWAVNLLGADFTSARIPSDKALRRAWCDKLLDDVNPNRVLEEYKKMENNQDFKKPMDELMRYEALCLYEDKVAPLNTEKMQMLTELLQGKGQRGAIQFAAGIFKGQGALPGYLRRLAEKNTDPEALLIVLSDLYEDNPGQSARSKQETVLAVMGHFFYPDSQTEPVIEKRKQGSYETCPTCLVQKLQPWNELKLASCPHNHRLCKSCFKNSMSTATSGWGACAGVDDDGKPCTALASRKEMEMAGMDKDKIYNILRKRVVSELNKIKGWKQCDAPGCIGGRSKVTKDFYSCRLCKKMVTKDGGKSDPTVAIRLLKGLDGTPIARGEGLFRECYHCAVIYEKGNACSTITCQHCQKPFSMTWGPEHISHRFDEEGVGPQMYVPKKEGKLWELGVFKTKKGKPLTLGQVLNEKQAQEVVRRATLLLKKLDG